MNSTRTRRILIWGFPILIVGVLVFFFIADKVIQSIDQSYQEARQTLGNWTSLVKYPFYIPMISRQNQTFCGVTNWRGDKPCNASCGRIVLYSSSQCSVIVRTSSKLSNK